MCFQARDLRAIATRTKAEPRFGASRKGFTNEPQTNRRFEPPRAQTAIAGSTTRLRSRTAAYL
eukprot:4998055-Alexandrium_andersonii.AAC.1